MKFQRIDVVLVVRKSKVFKSKVFLPNMFYSGSCFSPSASGLKS